MLRYLPPLFREVVLYDARPRAVHKPSAVRRKGRR
jgi:hypothetical protein